MHQPPGDKVREGKEECCGLKMSSNALGGAPEIWVSFLFLPPPSWVTWPSYFPVFTLAGSKVPSSIGIARPAREGEEEEGGILHPGFVHDHLGTVLPGQRSCPLHSRTPEDPDVGWWGIFPGKWVSRKSGDKVCHPSVGTQPPPSVFLHYGEKNI